VHRISHYQTVMPKARLVAVEQR